MIDDSMDSQILTHEQHAIELLARETHTSIAKVQEIFLVEHAKLAVGARIQSYLPVLTGNRVRVILDERNAAMDNEGHLADTNQALGRRMDDVEALMKTLRPSP